MKLSETIPKAIRTFTLELTEGELEDIRNGLWAACRNNTELSYMTQAYQNTYDNLLMLINRINGVIQ